MLLVCHVYFDPGEYILILGIEADPPNLEIIFLGPENPTVYRTSERSVVVIFFETQRWQVVMTNVATLRAAIVAIQCPEPLPPSRYLNLDPLCSRNLELRRSKPLEKPTKYYLNVERRLMKKLPMTSTLHVGRYGGRLSCAASFQRSATHLSSNIIPAASYLLLPQEIVLGDGELPFLIVCHSTLVCPQYTGIFPSESLSETSKLLWIIVWVLLSSIGLLWCFFTVAAYVQMCGLVLACCQYFDVMR